MSARKRLRAALYARYSTEKQSENSVEDQFRVCAQLCEREGFEVVARFSDAAISGGTANRPGYQRLLEAARRGEFDAIVAEDTSRLWRELSEQWRALKELADAQIAVVTHDVDTRRQESKVLLSVTGAMSEAYREEIARRTRRGLEGRAVAGASVGGRAYGYVSARDSTTGRVEINDSEAAIVRRVFEMYAEGTSPRSIAARLNAEGVPSPGASWHRKNSGLNAKRRGKWVASAIHGDARRGTGILNNERYIGRLTWGRLRWKRGAADSSKRTPALVEDRSQWITHDEPRLRIVSDKLWKRVKARQSAVAVGARIRAPGRRSVTLLSGLLVCASCGSRFIAVDQRCYGCASYKQGGIAACSNTARVNRERTEAVILAELDSEILSEEAVAHAQKLMREELRRYAAQEKTSKPAPARIAKLDTQAQELRALLKSGTLSATVAQAALDEIERERVELLSRASRSAGKASAEVIRVIPHTAQLYRDAVQTLNTTLKHATERLEARALIGELLGGEVKVRQDGEAVYAQLELDTGVLVAAAGNSSKINCFQSGSGGSVRSLTCEKYLD